MAQRALSSGELCRRNDALSLCTKTMAPERAEALWIWLIQLGVLRREVDGQGLTHRVRLTPMGSEGYAKAEVTLGGISTHDLHARDCQARNTPGLFAIGEAVDVTGWLGGYNFQWAWASGWAAGGSA